MNNKMTTNSHYQQLNLKKLKLKLSKQLEQEQNHRNRDHIEGYQWEDGGGKQGRKGTGNKKHNWQAQNRQGEVKNSIENREVKELICMTMDMN